MQKVSSSEKEHRYTYQLKHIEKKQHKNIDTDQLKHIEKSKIRT